ncbi:MAG TPA: hypothetical protein DCX10_07275, partial [Verrucomicrobiales bacterium]|nr:hypothetical protein [Verrucomicrobiales bacterium]
VDEGSVNVLLENSIGVTASVRFKHMVHHAEFRDSEEARFILIIISICLVVGVDPSISVFFKDRLNTNNEAYLKYR